MTKFNTLSEGIQMNTLDRKIFLEEWGLETFPAYRNNTCFKEEHFQSTRNFFPGTGLALIFEPLI